MNLNLIKMNLKSVLCIFLIIILSINGITSMAIFGSKPGEIETSPSIQLMLRNFGLGLVTDPIFFRIKKRWDLIRSRSTGKTTILEKLIFGSRFNHLSSKITETIDDIYIAYVDNERGSKEKICFYDTGGFNNANFSETIKNYVYYSDAIVLVYSVKDFTSFAVLDHFKKLIDRIKEKKELPIVCLANKIDDKHDIKVDFSKALSWAQKEKIRLYEVTSIDRKTLIEPFTYISSKLNQPPNKSTFTQLSRKVKGSNYSIEL